MFWMFYYLLVLLNFVFFYVRERFLILFAPFSSHPITMYNCTCPFRRPRHHCRMCLQTQHWWFWCLFILRTGCFRTSWSVRQFNAVQNTSGKSLTSQLIQITTLIIMFKKKRKVWLNHERLANLENDPRVLGIPVAIPRPYKRTTAVPACRAYHEWGQDKSEFAFRKKNNNQKETDN